MGYEMSGQLDLSGTDSWTPRRGMQSMTNCSAWQSWHRDVLKDGYAVKSRKTTDNILMTPPSDSELQTKRYELWEGLHHMQRALDEVYLSMLAAPKDRTVAEVWSFHMSQLLYDILEGCDYIQRCGQLYAAQSHMNFQGGVQSSSGDYTKLQQELGNRRQQARDLLKAVRRGKDKESTSWMADWFPFVVCCTNRPPSA